MKALYSCNADKNSHYTRGNVILKVALYSFMSTPSSKISIPSTFNRFLVISKGFPQNISYFSFGFSMFNVYAVKVEMGMMPKPTLHKPVSHYIRVRTILKVALYENSGAIFSYYIRGRVVPTIRYKDSRHYYFKFLCVCRVII